MINLNTKKIFLGIFVLGLVLRLWHITNPLLDEHAWKQTSSAIVARNYVSNFNLFRPAHDLEIRYPMATGLFEYIVGTLGRFFGFSDLLGRLTSLFISLIGFVFLYMLVRRFWGDAAALWTCFFYAFLPVSVFYSRSFQGDGSMTAMTIVFIYFFTLWIDTGRWAYFVLSIVSANLAFLFKIPSLFILMPAAGYLFLKERFRMLLNWRMYLFLALSTAFPLYFHWRVPIETNGMIYSAIANQDKWGGPSILTTFEFWWRTFYINLSEYHYTHTGYIFFLLGLFKKPKEARQWVFYFWLVSVALFFVVAAKGVHHEYYPLPLMPVACTFIGRFLAGFFVNKKYRNKKFVFGFVCFMVFYSFVFSMIRLNDRYKIQERYLSLAEIVKNNSTRDESILVMSNSEPEIFYYAHRRGIHVRDYGNLKANIDNARSGRFSLLAVIDFNIKTGAPSLYKSLKNEHNIIYESTVGMVIKFKR